MYIITRAIKDTCVNHGDRFGKQCMTGQSNSGLIIFQMFSSKYLTVKVHFIKVKYSFGLRTSII